MQKYFYSFKNKLQKVIKLKNINKNLPSCDFTDVWTM